MRVLYVDHTAKIGGGEIALLHLVRHLDPGVIEPMVLLFTEGPLVSRLMPVTETHVLALPADVGDAKKEALGWRSVLKLKAVWTACRHVFRVARFIQGAKPDLIHTNSLKADILGGLAGRLAGVPVIWHVRDRIDPDYLPKLVVSLFRLLCRLVPHYLIANSAATLATLERRIDDRAGKSANSLLAGTRYAVVHDGCELHPLAPRTVQDRAHPRVGIVGRISPWKGQDVFLKAAATVLTRYPGMRVELIGSALFAEREYEQYLHELSRSLGIAHAVDFTGFIEDVPARLAQLDILVHASKTGEPFGQVIIEGMAAGKPVVATRGGGVPEIVQDGVTGILVPMNDPESMAEAIEQLLAFPERAEAMGRKGRERVVEQFTIQKTAREIEAIYAQLLNAS